MTEFRPATVRQCSNCPAHGAPENKSRVVHRTGNRLFGFLLFAVENFSTCFFFFFFENFSTLVILNKIEYFRFLGNPEITLLHITTVD